MKLKSVLFFFLLSSTMANAQKANYRLKLFNSFQYFNQKNTNSSHYNNNIENFQILKLMPAFSVQRNKVEMDFVFNQFGYNKSNFKVLTFTDSVNSVLQNIKSSSFNLGVQIATYKQFKESKNQKLVYCIGSILSPNIFIVKSSPEIGFKTKLTTFSLNGYIVPKIAYRLKENITLEFNLPIQLFGFTNYSTRIYNSRLTAPQQTTTTGDVSLLPQQFMLNVGLGVKL